MAIRNTHRVCQLAAIISNACHIGKQLSNYFKTKYLLRQTPYVVQATLELIHGCYYYKGYGRKIP